MTNRSIVVAALVGAWTAGLSTALPALTWVAEQQLMLEEVHRPAWLWPLAGVSVAVLAGIPAYLLAQFARSGVVRAVGRTWATGAGLLGLLGAARAIPIQHNELYLAVLAVLTFAAALLLRPGAAAQRDRQPGDDTAWGVLAGLACLLPWLLVAGLGGLLETGLALLAAAGLGLLGARLLARLLWPAFTGQGRLRVVLLGGLAAGVALAPLAVAAGASGVSLLSLVAVPPLGFVAAALRAPRAVTAALGLAVLGPLAFVEPVQASAVLGPADVGLWALLAAFTALSVAIILGIGYGLGLHRSRRWVAGFLVASVAAGDLVGYLTVGHPGLYGSRLFVVLKAQADLSGLAAISDVHARRAEAYRRLVEVADDSQRSLRHDLTRLHLHFTPYYLVNGMEVAGGPEVRAWLSRRAEVRRVLLNPVLRPVAREPLAIGPGPVRPDGRPQWNVQMLRADRVWATGDTGTGIVVGTSDTGVDGTHPALAAGFRGGDDSWYDPWHGTRTPTDHNGHGTHTLGTAVGRDGTGVAPGAQWIGCVNLDRNLGSPSGYLDCLQFMLAPFPYRGDPLSDGRPERAADVLTNSWGCAPEEGCDRDALRPAVDALTAAGIFVVAAAGNTGPRCGSVSDPPARYPDTFTVGAVDRQGRLAPYSSRGSDKPDVVAPGTDVASSVPGGGYRRLTGTSMAAPQVAGVVALLWAANPALIGDVQRTAALLRRTALPMSGDNGCGEAGGGLVDAYAAVRAARRGGP